MSDSIPTGKLRRAGVAGLAVAKVGAKQLGHLSKRPFLSREQAERQRQEIDDASAEAIFEALSHLRGTALKVAQMLSMETDLLPERYRRELARSYHQVPPLNRALIRKVMIDELGTPPEKLFASFEAQAFAAASLGQVHAATDAEGRRLAVKVQYPGIDATIRSDIQLVRQLIRPLPDSDVIGRVLGEIEARLHEETDYLLEAENARWFAAHLDMEGVMVPEVFESRSSRHVLCMEHLDGMHLRQWLQTGPSQQQRNDFAQMIYDLYIHSVFELHRLHADPNPGNYLFRNDGRLGLIDFGCVKTLSPEFAANLSILYRSMVHDRTDLLLDTYRGLGMLDSTSGGELSAGYCETVLQPFGEWVARPFRSESFDFAAHPGYAAEGLRLFDNFRKQRGAEGGYLEVNPDFVFTDRTIYFLYRVFEEMGATLRMQNRWTC